MEQQAPVRGGGASPRTSPRPREHHIAHQDVRLIERDYGSTPTARDRFQEEMERMESEMRRFHEGFRPAGGPGGATGPTRPVPSFSSTSSATMGPDRHRTTMDVQLLQPPPRSPRSPRSTSPGGGSSLLSVVPTFQATPPPPPRDRARWPVVPGTGWNNYFANNPDSSLVEHTQDGKQLRLRFDVSQYKPDEVSVKTTGHRLKVAAKHEDQAGGGEPGGHATGNRNFREFSKEFQLPDNIDPELLRSSLSKDGILTVEAPLPEASADIPARDY